MKPGPAAGLDTDTPVQPEPQNSGGAAAVGVPRLPHTYVARPRLGELLDRATLGSVTAVVAPASAGKTLGVAGWLRRKAQEGRDVAKGVTWVNADENWHADLVTEALDAASSPAHASAAGLPGLLVIDDAHLLPASAWRLVNRRLNDAPDSMRLLVISRWDPPLSRLVPELLGHLTILRGDLLRMDDAECGALIAAHARTNDPEVLRAIAAYSQGWCGAAVLCARAVGAATDPVAAARRYTQSGTHVADGVADEVFAALRLEERHVLLCVATEGSVGTSRAVHLSHDERAGEVLARLEMTGLLVSRSVSGPGPSPDADADADEPVGNEPRYRIHPLLVEVVRQRWLAGGAEVDRARAAVSRAVHLDIERGDVTDALDRLVALDEPEAAARSLEKLGMAMVSRGEGPAIARFVTRHLDAVLAVPGSWFPIALERWVSNDVEGARPWFDRILDRARDDSREFGSLDARRACVRLMRSRQGLEPIPEAVRDAQAVVASARHTVGQSAMPHLLTELGITQNWTGDLEEAEVNLSAAIQQSRLRELPALEAAAAGHLAFTEYMSGREFACGRLAAEALDLLADSLPWHPRFAVPRATLALQLCALVEPRSVGSALPMEAAPVHVGDITTQFWLRIHLARLQVMGGSVTEAIRSLEKPFELPPAVRLPVHLRVVELVDRSFLAHLSGDQVGLRRHQTTLAGLGLPGEAALVAGLHADLVGDRRRAVEQFETAADAAVHAQPPTRALALAAQAQLLDVLGHPAAAMRRLHEAAVATETRRNAAAFLGWSRQGTPMEDLLRRLDERGSSSWVRELARATTGRPDVRALAAVTTPTPREQRAVQERPIAPRLSPREREVLNELARGSTYADIGANLCLSQNTVKTHVSGLYAKLGVSRRSEALAVARSWHLM